MTPLAAFLALGRVNPVTGAFTELTGAGYARAAVSLVPGGIGAPQAGAYDIRREDVSVITALAGVTFPAPTADWTWSALAIFPAATGGQPAISWAAYISPAPRVSKAGQAETVSAGEIEVHVTSSSIAAGTVWESKHGTTATVGTSVQVLPGGVLLS